MCELDNSPDLRGRRLLVVHQRSTLPWLFDAADAAGVGLVVVPIAGDDEAALRARPAVVEVCPLDLTEGLGPLTERVRALGVHGIYCAHDGATVTMAAVADALGLPGSTEAAARIARSKSLLRRWLAEEGLPTPAAVGGSTVAELGAAAERLTFPVVVKPADGYSSAGVSRVDSPAALPAAVEAALRAGDGLSRDVATRAADRIVVEEYLPGREIVAECLVEDGAPRVLLLGDKGAPEGPHFEEGVYQAPAALPETTQARIRADVATILARLGVGAGAAHVELRLGADGTPYVIDIGLRVGGSGVSHWVVRHATGLDYFAAVFASLLGRSRPVGGAEPAIVAGAGNYIVQTGGFGVIDRIDGLEDPADGFAPVPDRVEVVRLLAPGDEVRPYPEFSGYPAFVLSAHADAAALRSFHAHLDDRVRVRYR